MIGKCSNSGLDPRAPLIVIGAGRSGSTLLKRVLDAHPAISFHGETKNLSVRLWKLVFDEPCWFLWNNQAAKSPTCSQDCLELIEEEFRGEKDRVTAILAETFFSILAPRPTCTHWGFKDLWNGSACHTYPWKIYDALFPRATWLHLIRDPLHFAESCARWFCDELTEAYLRARLDDWIAMLEYSRQRCASGRFHEIHYEDLVARPRETLTPVLQQIGLDWSDACAEPLRHKVLASQRKLHKKEQAILENYPRLKALAQLGTSLGR